MYLIQNDIILSKYDTCEVENILSDLAIKNTLFRHDIMLKIIL